MCRVLCVLAAASLLALSTVAMAATIHVPGTEPTIQAGIDAASYGDTVLVACGTYYEHDIMMKSGVCLRSETGFAHSVTIDAQQHYLWAFVIGCMDTDASTSIVGFTMTGGYHATGGAMWCQNSSLALRNVSFTDNYADHGGGLYCLNSSVLLENVTFMRNWANFAGGGVFGCDGSTLTLTSCTLAENVADPDRDAKGGGIYCIDSSVTLTDCHVVVNEGCGAYCRDSETIIAGSTFASNTGRGLDFLGYEGGDDCTLTDCRFVENAGGGMSCWAYCGNMTLTGCSFVGNTTDVYGSGGGICAGGDNASLTNCTFVRNTAHKGGAFRSYEVHPTFSGCTIVENHAIYGGAIYCGSVLIANSIIAFNTGENPMAIWSYGSDVSCNDFYGNEGGDPSWCGSNGNICEDPLFCGDENPDAPFTLYVGSPCAPESNPECGQIGAWDVGCEAVTPVQATSWGSIKAMFR